VPVAAYACDGFCKIDAPKSPKSHRYDVIVPVLASVNVTVNGAAPVNGAPVKLAVGAAAVTLTYPTFVDVLNPNAFVAFNVTVYNPFAA
jgi:hypothetical protein